MKPIVSVVLPVYNCEKYIQEAIESLLSQSFKEFELIIIDDKSTDDTVEVIRKFKDSRIKIYLNKENIGRAASDNFAISVVNGEFIAKMDGDDVCHPHRLEKQVLYLKKHPEINVVGSWIQSFGDSKYLHRYPKASDDIKCKTLLGMPVGNSSLMFRSELFLTKEMKYNGSLRHLGEDYDFFARYMNHLNIHVIQMPLLYYRTYPSGFKNKIIDERKAAIKSIRLSFLKDWEIPLSAAEYDLLDLVYNLDTPLLQFQLEEVRQLFEKIDVYNSKIKIFAQDSLRKFLAQRWFYVCYHCQEEGLGSLVKYYKSRLSVYEDIPISLKVKFFCKGMINYVK